MLLLLDATLYRKIDSFEDSTSRTHTEKLRSMGIANTPGPCDPNKVIFNYSNVTLSPRLKTLLAFGLDFCLPIFKLNFYNFFSSFEKLFVYLKKSKCSDLPQFKLELKSLAYKYYYGFKGHKIFSVICKKDIALLQSLASDENVIVNRPDKGRGIVVLDKSQYVDSMNNIISDRSKFEIISDDIVK